MKNTIKILYAIINTHKERLFTFLLIAILISGAMYGFLLKNTIDNVVEREKLSKETKSLLTNISDLETKYFSLKNDVTIDIAYSRGFKNPVNTEYISKKSVTAMVSKNEL
jgi:hypothetical protein